MGEPRIRRKPRVHDVKVAETVATTSSATRVHNVKCREQAPVCDENVVAGVVAPGWRAKFVRESEWQQRTVPAAKTRREQGDALTAIILKTLTAVMVREKVAPDYFGLGKHPRQAIISWVLAETNARLKALVDAQGCEEVQKIFGCAEVGWPCVRIHLNKYWKDNPLTAPPK
jgi:hypothetical protein